MSSLIHDIRYGIRMLAKSPGATAIALITLGLGIGVNTGMFSMVDAFEHSVPRRLVEPERLVALYRTSERFSQAPMGATDWRHFRKESKSFTDVGLYRSTSLTLTGQGEPERVQAVRSTANLLPILGLKPQLGRLATEKEDSPAGEPVAVLTDRLWERKYASDPDVLGQMIVLDDNPYTIVGVLSADFRLENMGWYGADLLLPLRTDPAGWRGDQSFGWAVARLAPGVTVEQAHTECATIAARLAQEYPNTNANVGVRIRSLLDKFVSPEDRLGFLAMLAAVGLVLLIACLNLANLLLAKATARGREFAVRAALGAGRMRIIRQLLTESLLLAVCGGAIGLLIGRWAVDAFIASQDYMPIQRHEVGLNWDVMAYALIVTFLAALAFGLAPALTATRVSVNEALKEGQSASTIGRGRNRLRNVLIVGQLAVSLPLLVCCGLTLRHVRALRILDFGYNTERLLTLHVELPEFRYKTGAQQKAFYEKAIETVRSTAGIEDAGAAFTLPIYSRSALGAKITIEGRTEAEPWRGAGDVWGYQPVTPGFFETLEVPLTAGRLFTEHDHAEGQPVAIINQRMARRYWPDEDPIGKRLTLDRNLSEASWMSVVGVVADVGYSLQGSLPGPPAPTLYVPHRQKPYSNMYVVARTTGDPKAAIPAMRSALRTLDPGLPIGDFRTVQEIMHELCRDDRLAAGFLGGLAVLALGLASIGLYGVMSYVVQQLTHEIGVRVALGAVRQDIMRMVLRRCIRLTAIGIGVGLAVSIPVGLVLESQLLGVSGIDPPAYATVTIVLLLVALQAGYLPARRATKVDPIVALRHE